MADLDDAAALLNAPATEREKLLERLALIAQAYQLASQDFAPRSGDMVSKRADRFATLIREAAAEWEAMSEYERDAIVLGSEWRARNRALGDDVLGLGAEDGDTIVRNARTLAEGAAILAARIEPKHTPSSYAARRFGHPKLVIARNCIRLFRECRPGDVAAKEGNALHELCERVLAHAEGRPYDSHRTSMIRHLRAALRS